MKNKPHQALKFIPLALDVVLDMRILFLGADKTSNRVASILSLNMIFLIIVYEPQLRRSNNVQFCILGYKTSILKHNIQCT